MQSLKRLILRSKSLKVVYKSLIHPFVLLIKKITKINNKKIIFISFGGEKFDDSPRVIYEQMIKDQRFDKFEIIWALDEQAVSSKTLREINERSTVTNPNSLNYFRELFSSRTWITNVSVKRGLNFSSDNHLYINTWHGTPIKYIGSDTKLSKPLKQEEVIYLSQTEYEMNILPRAFNVDKKNILQIGLPRNEKLKNNDNIIYKEKTREKFGIKANVDVILYAPTWRENSSKSIFLNLEKLSKNLNSDQLLLFRGHHAMYDKIYTTISENFIDVSLYENLNDLLLISDVLITDYSSIMVDYSILDRPILLYISDYEEYKKSRGLYFNLFEEFKSIIFQQQNELEEYLLNYNIRGIV